MDTRAQTAPIIIPAIVAPPIFGFSIGVGVGVKLGAREADGWGADNRDADGFGQPIVAEVVPINPSITCAYTWSPVEIVSTAKHVWKQLDEPETEAENIWLAVKPFASYIVTVYVDPEVTSL